MDESTTISPNLYYWRPASGKHPAETHKTDLCIYGANAGAVAAAVQASRDGLSVVIVAPERNPGGLTTGGLSCTDFGHKEAIGGIAHEVYQRIGAKYGEKEDWNFEPHIAEAVLNEMLGEAKVPVYYGHFLAGIKKHGGKILSLTTEERLTVEAKFFLDASYEGDLMARAGVRYTVGRESNATYGETINGVQLHDKHQFDLPVSPYVIENDPSSGLLAGVNPTLEPMGSGDKRIQAYCFRLCLTKDPANKLPYPKPQGYDRNAYILLERYLAAGWTGMFSKFDPLRGGKYDKNNHGGFSTDYIGGSDTYPEADYAERERIFQRHVTYQQGLMWFMANDPAVPKAIQDRWNEWGLCRDEFTDTGGWSRQLYVREARRLLGDVVMNEHHCRGKEEVPDSVGLASYTMDSHNCQRVVVNGIVKNEGDVQIGGIQPYSISYRAIVPKRDECRNLLVPVCLSASHIAYGSIRMEPVFMVLGQSAAIAVKVALDHRLDAVQDIPYFDLAHALQNAGQRLQRGAWG